jgi:glycosyltransferase involved in cell wall biosynthesis
VADARAALKLGANDVVIGAVGRLEPQKRFDLLLDAFKAVHAQRPNTRLVIAGDGSLRQALEAQRDALGMQDCCILTGHVNDVIPLHRGTAELVYDNEHGAIIPIGRVDRLIDGMEKALANPDRARTMAERARRRVEGELSFESRVRRVESIYHEVVSHA